MKITANPKLKDALLQDVKTALLQTGEDVITDIKEARVIPKRRGTLEKTLEPLDRSEIENLVIKIHSNTPYAARLYHHPEYHFHREPWSITHRDGSVETFEGNPNARGEWFQPWIKGDRTRWVTEMFAKHLKNLGDKK